VNYKNIILPKRSDSKYKDIDEFEPYELTQNIAYEMAIRNNAAKIILDELNELHTIKKVICDPENYPNSSKLLKEYPVWRPDHQQYFDKLSEKLIHEYLIYPIGYKKRDTDYSDYLMGKEILYTDKSLTTYKSNLNKNDGFIVSQGIHTEDETFDISFIHTNFKRHVYDTNQTYVALNFSLPEEELIAYITHIKDMLSITDDEKKLKSPMELLGNKLDKVIEPKSYLAQALANRAIYDGIKVYYVRTHFFQH